MKEQVLKSRLSEILDLTKINWENVFVNSSKNYVKVVAEYYNNGLTSGEIGKILDIDRHTI
nr:MAG TPA: helix-turn-helix domain protein [Caudoviricetes sp.]